MPDEVPDSVQVGDLEGVPDGVAEELWTSGYTLWNLMLGCRTRIRDRRVDLSLNINNLLDKDYFRSYAISTGAWGDGRTWRFAARIGL